MFSLAGSPESSTGRPGPMTPRWGRPSIGSAGLPGGTLPAPGSAVGTQPSSHLDVGDPFLPWGSEVEGGRATVMRLPQLLSGFHSSAAGTPLRSADGTRPPSYGGTAPNSSASIFGGPAGTAQNSMGNSNATGVAPPEANPDVHHASPQQVASRGGVVGHLVSVATLALVPWAQFVVVLLAFAFQGGSCTVAAWALLLLSLCFSALAMTLDKSNSRGPMYMYIAVLGVVATASGLLSGSIMYGTYTSQWWALRIRATYANVPPSDNAIGRADGGVISFTPETLLDLNRVIGYRDRGHVYCVAPVLDDMQQAEANFWAVGKDCCDHRWNFNCGDARDPLAKAGLVYQESAELFAPRYRAQYDAAARQAASVYGLSVPERPVFLTWSRDPEALEEELWARGSAWLWAVAGLHLAASVAAGVLLHALGARPSKAF